MYLGIEIPQEGEQFLFSLERSTGTALSHQCLRVTGASQASDLSVDDFGSKPLCGLALPACHLMKDGIQLGWNRYLQRVFFWSAVAVQ